MKGALDQGHERWAYNLPVHPAGPVLHVPYTFAPDPMGGTEVYVERLARAQRAAGHDAVVVAPSVEPDRTYELDGLRVRRFACATDLSLDELWGEGDSVAAAGFERALNEERPSLVHLHAFTSAVSMRVVRLIAARRIPTVLTYHTPTVSCARGTLLRWGQVPCNGELRATRCAACVLQGKGLPRPFAMAAAGASLVLGRAASALGGRGRATTALRMHELVARRHDTVRSLLNAVDRVIVLCDWTADVLRTNHVAQGRVRRIRHGLIARDPAPVLTAPAPSPPLRVAFVGRLAPEKGPDLLLRALAMAPGPLELDMYGLVPLGRAPFVDALRAAAALDPRVRLLPPIAQDEVIPRLATYHLVAVPSRWMETGPFVVLEAFAAGVPVLGARLGGIAEWVTDGVDGLLLPQDDPVAWARALGGLAAAPARLAALRAGVHAPIRFEDSVVRQVGAVYRELVGDPWPSTPELP